MLLHIERTISKSIILIETKGRKTKHGKYNTFDERQLLECNWICFFSLALYHRRLVVFSTIRNAYRNAIEPKNRSVVDPHLNGVMVSVVMAFESYIQWDWFEVVAFRDRLRLELPFEISRFQRNFSLFQDLCSVFTLICAIFAHYLPYLRDFCLIFARFCLNLHSFYLIPSIICSIFAVLRLNLAIFLFLFAFFFLNLAIFFLISTIFRLIHRKLYDSQKRFIENCSRTLFSLDISTFANCESLSIPQLKWLREGELLAGWR